jgi:hypothetical protein
MAVRKKTIERDTSWIVGLSNRDNFLEKMLLNSTGLSGSPWEKRVILFVLRNELGLYPFNEDWPMKSIQRHIPGPGGEVEPRCPRGVSPALFDLDAHPWKWDGKNSLDNGMFDRTFAFGNQAGDGVVFTCNPDLGEKKTVQRWVYSYYAAGSDPAFRAAQYYACLGCLRRLLTLPLTFGETEITFEQVLQSEFLRAVALDQFITASDMLQDQLQACVDGLSDPETILSQDKSYASWVLDAYFIRMERAAKANFGERGVLTDLSPEEIGREERRLVKELSRLKTLCSQPAQENSQGANPLAIQLDRKTGKLCAFTQKQHDVLVELYKWRRENTGLRPENRKTMDNPTERWKMIASGGSSRDLGGQSNMTAQRDFSGRLSVTPNFFPA